MQISVYAPCTLLALVCIAQGTTYAADQMQIADQIRAAHILIIDKTKNTVLVAEEYAQEGTVAFIGCSYTTPPITAENALKQVLSSDYGITLIKPDKIHFFASQASDNIKVNSIQSKEGHFFCTTDSSNIINTQKIKNLAIKRLVWFPIGALQNRQTHNNLNVTADHAQIIRYFLKENV